MPFLKLTTVFIIFWNLHISYHMFVSQKLKQSAIITNKIVKYQLTDGLPNDETLLRKNSKLHGIIV